MKVVVLTPLCFWCARFQNLFGEPLSEGGAGQFAAGIMPVAAIIELISRLAGNRCLAAQLRILNIRLQRHPISAVPHLARETAGRLGDRPAFLFGWENGSQWF